MPKPSEIPFTSCRRTICIAAETHPFNGVACNSQIRLIDTDKIELRISTSYSKDLLPETLTRMTSR